MAPARRRAQPLQVLLLIGIWSRHGGAASRCGPYIRRPRAFRVTARCRDGPALGAQRPAVTLSAADQRRRHNRVCARLITWMREDLRARVALGGIPLGSLPLPAGTRLDGLRAKSRTPDVIAWLPRGGQLERTAVRDDANEPLAKSARAARGAAAGSRSPPTELVLLEVTVCREAALAARAREKARKYADVHPALNSALGAHGMRAHGPVVVALGELGTVHEPTRVDLAHLAREHAGELAEAGVPALLADLQLIVLDAAGQCPLHQAASHSQRAAAVGPGQESRLSDGAASRRRRRRRSR